jgi:hypothetical protein
MAFQQAGLFDWRTVEKNIELPLELKGWDKAKRRARAQEMLELVKLPEFARHMPVATLWWHATARRDRASARRPPPAAAHGRTLRCPRRDDPRAHAGRAAEHLQPDRHHGRVRHALDPRGRLPVDPGGRDVAPPGSDHRDHRRRPRRPDRGHARATTRSTPRSPRCARRCAASRRSRHGAGFGGWTTGERPRTRFRRRPPAVFGVLFLSGWEGSCRGFDLKPYFLPSPSGDLEAFTGNLQLVWDATMVSGTNALVGLVAAPCSASALSFVLMRFRLVNDLVTPMAVALNAIPIVVLVSIFVNQYPSTSEMPRRLMATSSCSSSCSSTSRRGSGRCTPPTSSCCARTRPHRATCSSRPASRTPCRTSSRRSRSPRRRR